MRYNILQHVGAFSPGDSIASDDFPVGTDFDRLLRLGAISVFEEDDPPRRGRGRPPKSAPPAEVEQAEITPA